MDDLIERLWTEEGRRAVRLANSLQMRYAHREDVRALLREAAAEIERLRSEAIEWRGLFDMAKARADKAEARAERLAEALRLIAAPMRSDGSWNRDREACRQIARAALAAKSGGDA